jgi:hypothetical protein
MARKWVLFSAILLIFAVPPIMAQGHRQGGGGQGQGRQGTGMQTGQRQQAGTMSQMRQQTRDRMRVHATQQQQNQFRTCTQSSKRVRDRIREMKRTTRGSSINAQQTQRLQQQVQTELQTMQQERERLAASLNDEQKIAAQNRLQEMARNQAQLEGFSEALGFELEQASLNGDKIRDQVRDMDRVSKKLQQQQRDLGAELALD